MAAVLVCTSELLNSPPRVRLDVTLPAGSVGVSAYVTRVGPDGRTVPVRLADPAVVTGSAWVGYDYEAPYGALCTYSAEVVYYASGRVNLLTNPSFEVDTLGWLGNPGLARDATQSWIGAASARLDGDVNAFVISTPSTPCQPSTTYSVSAYVRGTGSAYIALRRPGVSTFATSGTVTLTGAWQRISVIGATPADLTTLSLSVHQATAGAQQLWIDGVLLEQSASVDDYFDGDTPDTATIYAWAGTAHASASIATPPGTPLTETPTDTALVDVADVWLIHPGIPDLSMMLAKVKSLGDRVRAVNRGIFEPFGRTMPIVVTDGKRKAPQSQLVIRTRTLAELAALQAVTADAATLLLNVPDALGWGQGAEYIALGDLAEPREVDIGADAGRLISGPYHVVSRPIGGSQAQRTWADLLAECATWQDVLDKYPTWLDVLAPTT